jgi:hypothetical protein
MSGTSMIVDFSGDELFVEMEEESTFHSKHTGVELRQVNMSLIARNLQSHRSLLLKLRKAEHEGICATDEDGKITGRWRIANSSFGCLGDEHNPEYYHKIQIEEVEELEIEKIYINELALIPYFYDEEFDCDDLSIKSRVTVTPEQDAVLRLLMKEDGYFQVVRHGISDRPREMRFSNTILWSRHGNKFKYEIIMVDKSYDERDRPLARLFQPQMSRMQSTVAAQAEILEAILQTMVTRKYLTEGDVAEMRKKASERVWDRKREFYEVKDIDDFLKPQPRLTWD